MFPAIDAASVESSVSRLLMSVSAVVSRPSLSAMDRLAVAISVWSSLMLVVLVVMRVSRFVVSPLRHLRGLVAMRSLRRFLL